MGGSSGEVGFPDYMETKHTAWLDTMAILTDLYEDPDDSSPYEGEAAFDPSTRLTNMDTRLTSLETFLDSLSATSDWDTHVSAGLTKANSTFPFNTVLTRSNSLGREAKEQVAEVQGEYVTDSDTNLQTFLSSANTELSTYIQSAIDNALSKATSIDDSVIDDLVDDYEEEAFDTFARSVNRFTGGMSDINATHTSSFVIGMALMERDFTRNVNRFRHDLKKSYYDQVFSTYMQSFANLVVAYIQSGVQMTAQQVNAFENSYRTFLQSYLTNENRHQQLTTQAVGEMSRILLTKLESEHQLAHLDVESQRIGIVAEKEQADRDIELDVMDARWPFTILAQAGQLLGSINGAPVIPEKPSTLQSSLGGGASGAAAGATIGAKIGAAGGPIGATGGAVIGGVLGLAGGLS